MKLEESVTFFPHWPDPREVLSFTLLLRDIEMLWLEDTWGKMPMKKIGFLKNVIIGGKIMKVTF